MRKIVLVLALVSFLAVLIAVGSFLIAIQDLGVGGGPSALAKEADFLYVLDHGAGYPSDCWCVYAGRVLFQPTIWKVDSNNWAIAGRLKSSESQFNSRKQWILDEQKKRYLESTENEEVDVYAGIVNTATGGRGFASLGMTNVDYFESEDDLFIFPHYVWLEGRLSELELKAGGGVGLPVKIIAIDKKNYQIREIVLSKGPFQKYKTGFSPSGLDGGFWADESDIVYVQKREAYGEKPGVLFAFDSQTGEQKAVLELDLTPNKIMRSIISLGNLSTYGLFVSPGLVILWAVAIIMRFKR